MLVRAEGSRHQSGRLLWFLASDVDKLLVVPKTTALDVNSSTCASEREGEGEGETMVTRASDGNNVVVVHRVYPTSYLRN